MSRSTNLIIWLIGLLGCAIPIVIIYVSNMLPDAGTVTGVTFMDVARQAYANVLFLVIAISGIAIAEAIILFFKMVEVGEQKATPALWLLTMVLLIVFSSISYARVLGSEFDPASVSDHQLMLACIGAAVAILAALSLRMSMIRLEAIARQHIHDNAVMSTLEDLRDGEDIDLYDYDPFPTTTTIKDTDAESESRIPDPPARDEPAAKPEEPPLEPEPVRFTPATKISAPEPPKAPEPELVRPKPPKPVVEPKTEAISETPETQPAEKMVKTVVLNQKPETKPAEKAPEPEPEPEPTADARPIPVSGSKVKRARARARAKSR